MFSLHRHAVWLLLLASPALAAEPSADDRPTALEETVRFLGSALTPNQESIDYLAQIDPRTGRPREAGRSEPPIPVDQLDQPLPHALASLGFSYDASVGALQMVAASPDGRVVATGHCSGRVQLWDPASGRRLRGVRIDRGFLTGMTFSPDGRTLATVGAGMYQRNHERAAIHLWDVRSGLEILTVGGGTQPMAAAFSPDGKELASGGLDGRLHFWDPQTGEELRQFKGTDVSTLAYAPDGRTIAFAAERGPAVLWDVSTGKERLTLPLAGGRQYGWFLTFSADGRRLAVGNEGGASVWDMAAEKFLAPQFPRPNDGRRSWTNNFVALAPDGRTLATANGRVVSVFDSGTGQERLRLMGTLSPLSVVYAPDGRTLISGCRNGLATIWDLSGRRPNENGRTLRISQSDLSVLGRDLKDADASSAYVALVNLASVPRDTLCLVRDQVGPPPAADPKRIQQLIADLENDTFHARQRAAAELEKLGDAAIEPLARSLAGQPSLELKQRVERLLDAIDPPVRVDLLTVNAVSLLERIGSTEARRALERLTGSASTSLAQEARAALKRLGTASSGP